jgi:hypothetical protein
MRNSLAMALNAIRHTTASRVVRIALASAAIFPSVPALAQRHEQDRRSHGEVAGLREEDSVVQSQATGDWQAPAVRFDRPRVLDGVWTLAMPPGKRYYCESAKGWYPSVHSCPGGWRALQAGTAPSVKPAVQWQ